MRILAVSDVASPYYYDHYTLGRFDGIDLILACGDLRREYLEFLVTLSNKPLLYVPGNHDEAFVKSPPEGCVCIDDRLYVHEGVRFLGLGGSYRYREGTYMYTEKQMESRIRRLGRAIRRNDGFDVLVTHAPARHINDLDTLPHRGFECFGGLLDKYQPRYFVHGHIHMSYGVNIPQKTPHGPTQIINAYDHCLFEY